MYSYRETLFQNKLDKYYIDQNLMYRRNVGRLGVLRKENDDFKNSIELKNIIKLLKLLNIHYVFDRSTIEETYKKNLTLAINATNYGVIIRPSDISFYLFLFEKYFKDKNKLEKNVDVELSVDDAKSKYDSYYDNLDKEIENLVVISSHQKHRTFDWKLINSVMTKPNSFLKLHPVLNNKCSEFLIEKYGSNKIISKYYSLDNIIKKSKNIYVSACTESVFTASLLDKKLYFLHEPNYFVINKIITTYPILYYGLYNNHKLIDIINTGCVGIIPWKDLDNHKLIVDQIIFLKNEYDNWKNSNFNNF